MIETQEELKGNDLKEKIIKLKTESLKEKAIACGYSFKCLKNGVFITKIKTKKFLEACEEAKIDYNIIFGKEESISYENKDNKQQLNKTPIELKGKELIEKIKQIKNKPIEDKAIASGYYFFAKNHVKKGDEIVKIKKKKFIKAAKEAGASTNLLFSKNSDIPTTYNKKYYDENKEKLKEVSKKYREKNKELIAEKEKQEHRKTQKKESRERKKKDQ